MVKSKSGLESSSKSDCNSVSDGECKPSRAECKENKLARLRREHGFNPRPREDDIFKVLDSVEKAFNEKHAKKLENLRKALDDLEGKRVNLEKIYKEEGKWKSVEEEEQHKKIVAEKERIGNRIGKLEENKDKRMDIYISAAKLEYAINRIDKITNKQFIYNLAVSTSQAINQAGVDCTRGIEDFVNNIMKIAVEGKL